MEDMQFGTDKAIEHKLSLVLVSFCSITRPVRNDPY
jgi:hypothetical protein